MCVGKGPKVNGHCALNKRTLSKYLSKVHKNVILLLEVIKKSRAIFMLIPRFSKLCVTSPTTFSPVMTREQERRVSSLFV